MNGDNPQTPDPDQAQSPWQYNPAPAGPQPNPAPQAPGMPPTPDEYTAQPPHDEIIWSASEFIAHEKDPQWYAMFGVATLVIVAITFFITRDIFSMVVILGLAGLVAITAGRKPRVVTYKVDAAGITVAGKFYAYTDFRSFGVVQEGAFSSIILAPLKRFAVPLSIYYDPKDEDMIMSVMARHLPIEQREHDPIDKLTRRIRF